MGSCCVSWGQRSSMKYNLSISSEADSVVVVKSSVKVKEGDAVGIQNSIGEVDHFIARSSPVRSSKELSFKDDIFFDSQPGWLDSDCDDYFSVADDETPSLDNTAVNPSSSIDHPESGKVKPVNVEDTATTEVKKQLFELFNESLRAEADPIEGKQRGVELPANSTVKKATKTSHCCLPIPRLVRSLSHGERKKRPKPVGV